MVSLPIPNYTQVPNFIIDEKMSELSPSEFKVIMLILRYTAGFHRRSASISFSHFEKKCNVSKKWTIECCKKLESFGWIKVIHGDGMTSNIYEICMESEVMNNEDEDAKGVVNSVHQGGELSTPGYGTEYTTIKKTIERNKNNNAPLENQLESEDSEVGPSAVVVPSFLKNLGISTPLCLALMKEFKHEELMEAVDMLLEAKKTQEIRNPYGWLKSCVNENYKMSSSPEERILENKQLAAEIEKKHKLLAENDSIIIEVLNSYLEIYHKDYANGVTAIEYKDPMFKIKLKEALEKWELMEENEKKSDEEEVHPV